MKILVKAVIEEKTMHTHVAEAIRSTEVLRKIRNHSRDELKNGTIFLIVTSDRRGTTSSGRLEYRKINSAEFSSMLNRTGMDENMRRSWMKAFVRRVTIGETEIEESNTYTTFIIYKYGETGEQLAIIPFDIAFNEGKSVGIPLTEFMWTSKKLKLI